MAKIWVAKHRPCSRVLHDLPDAIPAFAAAFPSAILAPMLTQEINTTQPGRIAQDGNNADKTMTASFDIRPFRRALIEADWKMPDDELRMPNRVFPTSKFELHLSNFASALPGQLFYRTQIPVCLWFLAKNKSADAKRGFRDRRLLINAGIAKA